MLATLTTEARNACRPLFHPADEWQRKAARAIERATVTFLLGGAGSGKTHVAVASALLAVSGGSADAVWLCRPTVPCGDDLGFMPGDVHEKLGVWVHPVRDVLGSQTFTPLERLPIEVQSLQHMRGRTVKRAVAVLDEAQNATVAQLRMFLTRVGDGGKLILTGDPMQSDLPGGTPLPRVVEALRGVAGVEIVQLRGQHRSSLVSQIDKRLSRIGG